MALTLRQDSHQLSLSGQGTLSPDGRYLFRGTLQPRQGMPPLLALLVTRPTANNAPGPTPWQVAGKMVTTGAKMTTLAALSLHFPFVWYGFLLLFGLALGSFYNVVIYRLPRMLTQTAEDERITLSTPGSSCPQCRQPIAWRDNIPLLSFLWLGRRARCCQAPIAWSYPLTELATGLLFILAGALLAPGLPLAGGLVLLSFLLILARIDARTQLLPDRLTLPLLWAGLLFNLNEVYIALPDAVAGAMAGYLALWSVYWLFRLLTGKEALGYGDFKLLAALGAWCGWQVLPQVLLFRFGQRAGVDPAATPVDPAVAAAAAGLRPLAGAGRREYFSLAADGLAFANRLAGQDAARQRRLRVFLLRRVGAALAGSSGQTRASDSVPSSLSAPRGSSLARRRSDRG